MTKENSSNSNLMKNLDALANALVPSKQAKQAKLQGISDTVSDR